MAVWHFVEVYMYIHKTLGHAAHACILFGKNHFPNSREDEKRSNLQ